MTNQTAAASKRESMHRAYLGPNGWYVAWEQGDGSHHQPADGGSLTEETARSIVLAKRVAHESHCRDVRASRPRQLAQRIHAQADAEGWDDARRWQEIEDMETAAPGG